MTLPLIFLRSASSNSEKIELDEMLLDGGVGFYCNSNRGRILELFEKYHILPTCVDYLEQNFALTSNLLNEFSNLSLKNDLRAFLNRFTDKFDKLSVLKTCNFLAV